MPTNFVQLEGKVTRYELQKLEDGTRVARIGLATYNGTSDKGPGFYDIDYWRPTKEQHEALNDAAKNKGRVLFSGCLRYDTWESNGSKQSRVKIVADTFAISLGRPDLDKKDEGDQRPASRPRDDARKGRNDEPAPTKTTKPSKAGKAHVEEDIPF